MTTENMIAILYAHPTLTLLDSRWRCSGIDVTEEISATLEICVEQGHDGDEIEAQLVSHIWFATDEGEWSRRYCHRAASA